MTIDQDVTKSHEGCHDAVLQLQRMASIVRLSSGLGHEFNNLMQTTIGALQLIEKLLEAGRASETARVIAMALHAAQDASAINQKLVNLARPHPSNPQPLNLNLLVADMGDLMRKSLPTSTGLTMDLAGELSPTQCDPHRAKIALLDLLFSVVDAVPGPRALQITTRHRYVDDQGVPSTDLVRGSYACVEATCSGEPSARNTSRAQAGDRQDPHWSGLEIVRDLARTSGGAVTFERQGECATVAALYLPCLDEGDARMRLSRA